MPERVTIKATCGCGATFEIACEYHGDARAAAHEFYTNHQCVEVIEDERPAPDPLTAAERAMGVGT